MNVYLMMQIDSWHLGPVWCLDSDWVCYLLCLWSSAQPGH
ncbi:cationic amino acid transporter 3-like [Prionailurus iriomotensis]